MRCGLLLMAAATTLPFWKCTVPSLSRSSEVTAQRPGLPAQVQQLEDVVDAELAERAFDRHGQRPPIRLPNTVSRSSARAHLAARAARVLAGGLELDHALPAVDRLAVPLLAGEQHAVVERRAGVVGIERAARAGTRSPRRPGRSAR